jgi:hypothetical protein
MLCPIRIDSRVGVSIIWIECQAPVLRIEITCYIAVSGVSLRIKAPYHISRHGITYHRRNNYVPRSRGVYAL